jgi:predicted exporter
LSRARAVSAAPLLLWVAAAAACLWIVIARTSYTADLTAFLPRSQTPAQALLIGQLRDGVAARLVLIGLEGADERALAASSRALARRLRASDAFGYVANGETALAREDREAVFAHRYLLSPAITPDRFTEVGLRAALTRTLEALASPLGPLVRPTLARDPTGETAAALAPHLGRQQPATRHGVWFDAGGARALLTAETRAPGYDLDAQARAQTAIEAAFAATRTDPNVRLVLSGPPVFAVQSRAEIEADAWRLAAIAGCGVALILFAAYRRAALVGFGTLPVASGMLAGIAAVSLAFGTVHGITLGFGATLIGEAADYSTYLFAQRTRGETLAAIAQRVWPTLRLAVLTTVFGSLAMLASSFTGLAQLGLLLFVGALAAGLVTRYVLPALVPERWAAHDAPEVPIARQLTAFARNARRFAPLVPLALVAGAAVVGLRHATLWEDDIAALSPVPESAKARDRELRDALGAPDVRHLLVVTAATRDEALARFEALAPRLDELVGRGIVRGFDTPARYLPSEAAQRARQAALPDAETLAARLARAAAGLPFREGLFAPFLADVAEARSAPLLTPDDLAGTAWGVALRALLFEQGGRWVGLAPLSGVSDSAALARAIADLKDPAVWAFDLKGESEAMIRGYRDQALALAAAGVVVIGAVLWIGLRRARAAADVMLPVLAAVGVTAAALVLGGTRLSLLHLVSFLLVLGIGTNYALFFNRFVPDDAARDAEQLRSAYAVVVATATTLMAFGALAFSGTAILQAIGRTVALGALLSLVFAAAWARAEPQRRT